ncbi:MAG: hypothetical protein ACPGPS_21850, partial [Rubripirellula sp.]
DLPDISLKISDSSVSSIHGLFLLLKFEQRHAETRMIQMPEQHQKTHTSAIGELRLSALLDTTAENRNPFLKIHPTLHAFG